MCKQFNVHAIYFPSNLMFKRFNVQATMFKRILMFKLSNVREKILKTSVREFWRKYFRRTLTGRTWYGLGAQVNTKVTPSPRHNPYRKMSADIKEKIGDKSQEYQQKIRRRSLPMEWNTLSPLLSNYTINSYPHSHLSIYYYNSIIITSTIHY